MNPVNEILKSLEVFATPGDVVELRVLDSNAGYRKENITGCFNDFAKMATEAAKLDHNAPAVYFTLNRCNPLIFARAPNKIIRSKTTTSDNDIIRRRWFPIDADALRPTGVSSPDGLHEAALAVADDIEEWLTSQGWPKPVKGDSGNGGHLCYRIDLPNDKANGPEITETIKAAITVIADKFTTDTVGIDRTVYNASRIWKLYGTTAGKGENIPGQPHRVSKILSVPDPIEIVPIEMIQKIAGLKKTTGTKTTSPKALSGKEIDVEEKCQKWNLRITRIAPWNDCTRYTIEPCPFNSSHKEGIILKHPNGAVSFNCPHNSCIDNHWAELRAKFEEKPAYRPPETHDLWEGVNFSEESPAIPRIDERINPESVITSMGKNVALQKAGVRVTLDMPWPLLSDRSGALRPGTVCVLAGPVKSGKSLLAMNVVIALHHQGIGWRYMPLEDDQEAWAWRALAILFEDFRYIEDKQETAYMREEALIKHRTLLTPLLSSVAQNPRVGVYDKSGKPTVPSVLYPQVLDWVESAVSKARLVVVDPFAQIDFDARKTYQQHQEFIRKLLAIVAGKNSTVLLVAHVGKRGGEKGTIPLTSDDVQGSVDLTRLAHTTIILDRHDKKQSAVYRCGGTHEIVSHNRTVVIAAARNGSGCGQRLAFDADQFKPHFAELGVIDLTETSKIERNKRK